MVRYRSHPPLIVRYLSVGATDTSSLGSDSGTLAAGPGLGGDFAGTFVAWAAAVSDTRPNAKSMNHRASRAVTVCVLIAPPWRMDGGSFSFTPPGVGRRLNLPARGFRARECVSAPRSLYRSVRF